MKLISHSFRPFFCVLTIQLLPVANCANWLGDAVARRAAEPPDEAEAADAAAGGAAGAEAAELADETAEVDVGARAAVAEEAAPLVDEADE